MRLKRYSPAVIFLLVAAGLTGIGKADSLRKMTLSIILSGLGIGSLFPCLLKMASERIDKAQSVQAMSVIMAFDWLGQFLSPLFFATVSFFTGLENVRPVHVDGGPMGIPGHSADIVYALDISISKGAGAS